ncbi:MAG: protein kinase [Deltaproteobacteria bacterium]|nr:protein kinase [Deltaproteobacteria bacterium]
MYELAHHRISEKIHHGNSSVIFRAKDTRTDRSVILKFLKNRNPGNELLRDFAREYSITASFTSDRIVKACSLEKYGNSLVMILEDCGAVSLASMISTVQKNIAWVLDIGIQLTRVLIEIHRKNIIHRDLNPSNIVYNGEKQTITVIDFGQARAGRRSDTPDKETDILSTALPYISPEQTGSYNKTIDYRTDLYSLGVTLYHLLTGIPPFASSDPMELIHLHLATLPLPPHEIDPAIPRTLSEIILKLISKSRKLRYQTCTSLLADLFRCRAEWHSDHAISTFSPGEYDLPDKLFSGKQAIAFLQEELQSRNCCHLCNIEGIGFGKNEKHEQPGTAAPDIVRQVNETLAGTRSPADRLSLIAAIVAAGTRVNEAESYETAHCFLQSGLSFLPENSWEQHYDLTLKLHIRACEAAYHTCDYQEVERLFSEVCRRASSLIDKTEVYHIRIRALKSRSRLTKAMETAREILHMLGVRLPSSPSRIFTTAQFFITRRALSGRTTADLLNLPEMRNRSKNEAMRFLVDMGTIAYHVKQELLPLIAIKGIGLTLQYGNSISAGQVAYPIYALLLCTAPGGNISKGYEYGQLALNLQQRLRPEGLDPSTLYVVTIMTVHWKEHLRRTLEPLLTAFRGCMEKSELEYAALAAHAYSYRLYYLGYNLGRAEQELSFYRTEIKKTGQQSPLHRQNIHCQAVANLTGVCSSPWQFQGDFYNEEIMIPLHEAAEDNTTLFQLYLLKAVHCFLFYSYDEALVFSDKAKKRLRSVLSSVLVPIFHFYESLILLALYRNCRPNIRLRYRFRINANQRKMKLWSSHSPKNYQHKFRLVEAEKARVQENSSRAMNLYDSAINLARTNSYLQEEALACELASRFYISLDKVHLALPYLHEARHCYYRWGAIAKVRQLDQQKPLKTATSDGQTASSDFTPHTFPQGEEGSNFNMATVVKASRILAEETTFPDLLKKIMKIMLESSGAQRGVLVFDGGENWTIKAAGSTRMDSIELPDNMDLEHQNRASSAIINFVIHTGKDIVLNDAQQKGMFTDDEYVVRNSPRSILCTPLTHRQKVECILYLENNLTRRAFSPQRQELLHLLGNQAAINIRNSRLFGELETSVKELQMEIEKRREIQKQLLHSEKLSALGRLSSSIAHEFGNPLIGVQYLLTDFMDRPNLNHEDRKLLALGMEECERMKKLLKDLGQLNRPTTGKRTLASIHRIMDNVLFFHTNQIKLQQLNVVKKYARDLPDIEIITDQISQVLFNLTINAVDATSPDGGTITISTRQTESEIFLSISDTGKGIEQRIQNNIFEPFFSTKREEDGTGLGLSTSYGIIKRHGGELTFVSKPGEGTTFTLSLPLPP